MESHDEPNVDVSDDDYNNITYERNRDAVIDANATPEHDGRAVTNTGWNPNDMDTKEEQRRWRYLNTLNDGYRSSERKEKNREANRRRDAKTFMCELGCSEYQKNRVLYLIDSFDGGSMGGTTDDETLIMGIISLVMDEDDRSNREIRNEQCWDELRSVLDIPQWKIGQVWDLLGRRDVMSNNQTGGALQYSR